VKLTPDGEWKRVPVALSGSARTNVAGGERLTVKAVLRTLGYVDAMVEPRDLNQQEDPLGAAAWAVDPAQNARCPHCGGNALSVQLDGRSRCLFCHFEADGAPESSK